MGKQVRFYMLPVDEKNFLDFLFQRSTVKLLRDVSELPEFNIDRGDLTDSPIFHRVYIWDSTLGQYTNSIQKHEYQKLDERLGTYINSGEKFYSFDRTDSSVIEYSRSFIRNDGKLTGGRIWAEMYRLEAGQLVRKEPAFIAWYDEIARWLRRYLKRDKELDAYVSQRAMEWHQRGGVFHRN